MPGLTGIEPPDDAGSDAFRRFRYQAHVAFPYCLKCWTGEDGIAAVYCEHFEDVLVESDSVLEFIAIKTRDAADGPWRLSDLCGPHGAFRSLLRTHRALVELDDARQVTLEARLEGALKRGDACEELRAPRGGEAAVDVVAKCAELLSCDQSEAEAFLRQIRIVDGEPPREVIRDRNLRFLRALAGGMSADALAAVHDGVIDLLETAMSAQLLDEQWPQAVVVAPSPKDALAAICLSKRVDREMLDVVFGTLSAEDRPLLIGDIDTSLLRATALERKLVAAGGEGDIVGRAKELRAHAGRRLGEMRASRIAGVEDELADVNTRLLTVAQAVASQEGKQSGNAIWLGILDRVLAAPAALDPSRLFAQDGMLLAGQICQLSDECRFEWGESST